MCLVRDRVFSASGQPDITQQLVGEDLPALFTLLTLRHSDQRFYLLEPGWGRCIASRSADSSTQAGQSGSGYCLVGGAPQLS